jgi:peptidoglycan/xylan/chitin deacetylase (PgdA/CDA1 family)
MAYPTWKQCLLGAYYCATLPGRRRAAVERAEKQTEPVRILFYQLFYHRIADEHPNDWTMPTVTFVEQVSWLRARFDIVTLSEAQSRIASGRNRIPTVCITFDDGYADNMRFAVPLLLKHQMPFTYFVSTDHVLRGQPFPHDVKAGQLLPPNTLDDLRELVAVGVEIGAHTRSHVDLGANLPSDQMFDEIVRCKSELESKLCTDIRYFAFPYGQHANLSAEAFGIAFGAGYDGVCSAYGGYNFPGDDPFHLRRFHADAEMVRFKNWLTIDPRKLRSQHDVDAGRYHEAAKNDSRRGAEFAEAAYEFPVDAVPRS